MTTDAYDPTEQFVGVVEVILWVLLTVATIPLVYFVASTLPI